MQKVEMAKLNADDLRQYLAPRHAGQNGKLVSLDIENQERDVMNALTFDKCVPIQRLDGNFFKRTQALSDLIQKEWARLQRSI
jgi:hypothetical protein